MSKSDTGNKTPQDTTLQLEQPEYWDICDPSDQMFWDEFFKIEELLELQDEIDPASFSITVQNHRTGETRSFPHIHLLSTRKKISC
jgi:hypothetical protein